MDGDFRDTVSHEKVSAMLRGSSLARWSKIEPVVWVLAAWNSPPLDGSEQAARVQQLWHAAANTPQMDSMPSRAGASVNQTHHLMQSDETDRNETTNVRYTLHSYGDNRVKYIQVCSYSWDEIFLALGPMMASEAAERHMSGRLAHNILGRLEQTGALPFTDAFVLVDDADFDLIKLRLRTLRLIEKGTRKRAPSDHDNYWQLTQEGDEHLVRLLTQRRVESRELPTELA
jgi:hypothetical protein